MKKIIIHEKAEKELWHAVEYYEEKVSGLGLYFSHLTQIVKSLLRKGLNPAFFGATTPGREE